MEAIQDTPPPSDTPGDAFSSSREPIDRVTDEMLTRPLRELSPAEFAIIRRANAGPRSGELVSRLEKMRAERRRVW